MKQLLFYIIGLLSLSIFSCQNKDNTMESDPLSQYRDTLVGKFNGIDIDTLICEPMDSLIQTSKAFIINGVFSRKTKP